MFKKESSIENVQHSPQIFGQNVDNVFSPCDIKSTTSCDFQALYPNGSEKSFMTCNGISDTASPGTDLGISGLASDLLSCDPLQAGCDTLESVEQFSDSLWHSDASGQDFWDFSGPSFEGMMRWSSVGLSEKTSSDAEWITILPYHGFSDSQIASTSYTCSTCQESFPGLLELEKHRKAGKRKQFACKQCTASFSRQDALTRHREIHDSQKLFSCVRCDATFRRRDHLRQHLQKKHRVDPNEEFPRHCSYECCSFSERFRTSDGFDGFSSRKEYSKHMRVVHGKETHDCDIGGCSRVGSRGFARKTDLLKHRKLVHER
jgi:uncharacterized C2H2 Zn-finger protein